MPNAHEARYSDNNPRLDEAFLDALRAVMIEAGHPNDIIPVRAVAVIEVTTPDLGPGDQHLVTMTTSMPGWTVLGLLEGCRLQTTALVEKAVNDAADRWDDEEDDPDYY